MFTLEEKSREWERRHPEYTPRATPEDERRYAEMCEKAELAWETSMAELGAFGNVWPEEGVSQAEYDEGLEEFWEFACDLYEEGETRNERLVLTELF